MDWNSFINSADGDVEPSTDELIIRIKGWRLSMLQMTDYTQLPDVPGDKAAWAVYRQDLRDLPQQGPDPKLWVFPTAPAPV